MTPSFAETFAAVNPRVIEAFNRGDFETALAGLAPDVEWHLLPDLPESGVLTSRAAAIRFFRSLLDSISWQVETLEIIDAGERCVIVHQRGHQVGRSTGIASSGDFFQVYEQREDGRIGRIREFADRESALAAAGIETPDDRGRLTRP